MIGSGLKKFALENGMKVDSGVAYGSLRGFAATMRDGRGFKQIIFTTSFADSAQTEALRAALNTRDLTKEFRVQKLSLADNGISIVFLDSSGTMKKIQEFVDWFIPLLQQHGAAGVQMCSQCGMQITDEGVWVLKDGAIAFHVHSGCARKMQESVATENTSRKDAATGSYASGAVGALLGAVLGAVVWALILMAGYVASLVALLIGFLANKGYSLLKGKEGKGKIAILIAAIVIGVLLGTFVGECLILGQAVEGAVQWQEIPMVLIDLFTEYEDVRGEVLGNLGMGLLFAGLGTFGMLHQESKNVADTKVKVLK